MASTIVLSLRIRSCGSSSLVRIKPTSAIGNIDAPEKAQPFRQRSKQALSDLAFGKAIECNQSGLDRYGRTIAVCSVGGTVINLAMVKAGMAWVYRKYAHNVPDYYAAEDEARRQRLGLWADSDPVPPWGWRKKQAEVR